MIGGWSGYTNASTSSQIHYFPIGEPESKSICGMANLSYKNNSGKFIKDLNTYHKKKICIKCKEKKGIVDLVSKL